LAVSSCVPASFALPYSVNALFAAGERANDVQATEKASINLGCNFGSGTETVLGTVQYIALKTRASVECCFDIYTLIAVVFTSVHHRLVAHDCLLLFV
jgi:hypothetical protein